MKKIFLTVMFLSLLITFGNSQSTKIIAHRGAWKNTKVPQNSIASLQAAIEQQVWGTEFDVHLTKDDVLVVNHDHDFYGIDIATATYGELLTKKHPNGEVIPTLDDYLECGMRQQHTKLILELKPNGLSEERTLKAAKLAMAIVKKHKALSQTVFISFSYAACMEFRALEPLANIQYLYGDKRPLELKADKINGLDYNGRLLAGDPTYISQAREIGIETNVWTINEEEHLRFFVDQKIDFITTDEPELLKKILER